MRYRFAWAWFIAATILALPAAATTYYNIAATAKDASGVALVSPTVTVFVGNTATAATIYSDGSGSSQVNPFTAGSDGTYSIYVTTGKYRIDAGGFTTFVTVPSAALATMNGICRPASGTQVLEWSTAGLASCQTTPAGGGGGGSGTVTSVATNNGITGGTFTDSGTIGLDYTATLAGNPAMAAGHCQFATTGIICEGATANTSETLLTFADPGSDITLTAPATTGTLALTSGNVATATALAANGANCTAGHFPLGVDASGAVETCSSGTYAASSTDGGAATTATALAANGTNCSAGNYPLGVDASGNAESCTSASGLSNPLTAGSVGTNSLQIVQTGTGIYQPATNVLGIAANGVDAMRFLTASSGVNYFEVLPSASSSAVTIRAAGSGSNLDINLTPKGSGVVTIAGNGLQFDGGGGTLISRVGAAAAIGTNSPAIFGGDGSSSSGVYLHPTNGRIEWGSGNPSTSGNDTMLSRGAAGVVSVDTSTAGNGLGALIATGGIRGKTITDTLPGTCTVGDIVGDIGTVKRLCLCTATNTFKCTTLT